VVGAAIVYIAANDNSKTLRRISLKALKSEAGIDAFPGLATAVKSKASLQVGY
jgi:hypothetical protein